MASSLAAENKTMGLVTDKCCLQQCVNKTSKFLQPGDARVNVRAFESKSKGAKSMAVDWREGGVASFHWPCWAELNRATKNPTPAITLSDVERSMILDAMKTAEFHDSDADISAMAKKIADTLKHSIHCIAFTGAGISTAAGIGDFRGIHGKWTERDKVKNYGAKGASKSKKEGGTPVQNLRPTYTHEALAKLQEMGLVKFLISQNTDGLHRLSGIPADKLAELHGNTFVEKCEKCETRFERSFPCRRGIGAFEKKCDKCRINHRTGRRCSEKGCDGYMINTIINFGDYLESDVLSRATAEARLTDAVLVLGSTLRVSPANDLVAMSDGPSRLMICNRQTTPYDAVCKLIGPDDEPMGYRLFGDCDILMRNVMRFVLSPEELCVWEDGRQARMAEYAMKRTAV
ncbi:hypothetical protein EGW08_001502 [Elysia chlorotica]|uniref:protein acetyllysine N-acetyltransferase n=1 Tax=Elysia chlorotica TaxID=188477 RepID=A0A433UA56_ELYCH|nr:hypothetical protein EGW08_001502 [Elysia chlorotica]